MVCKLKVCQKGFCLKPIAVDANRVIYNNFAGRHVVDV